MNARTEESVSCIWCGSTNLTPIGSVATRGSRPHAPDDGEVINAYQCECGMAFTKDETPLPKKRTSAAMPAHKQRPKFKNMP